jgi:hypothetical protein
VEVLQYDAEDPDEPRTEVLGAFHGKVQPHASIRILYMVGYGALSELLKPMKPVRRYGENEGASIREDGSTFFVGRQYEIESVYRGEKPGLMHVRGSYAEKGDSGGPCFRERKGVLELVGVAKSTLSPLVVLSSYTSVPKYLEWIRQRVTEVEARRTE